MSNAAIPNPVSATPGKKLADTGCCIIRIRQGERIGPELAALLDPVNAASFHEYRLPANTPVELHRHENDEYWWFTSGTPVVTLWSEAAGLTEYQLQPGDLVACLRGVAHTLRADHELVYFQFTGEFRPGVTGAHLTEGVPTL